MIQIETSFLTAIVAIAGALTASGAAAMARKGYGNGEIIIGALFLGPLLVLAPALSDKRVACPQCKNRNEANQRCCGTCGVQLRA